MASELLKRQALINKLKEPETANINFDLADSALDYSIESIEEDILPEAKPQELFDERDRLRIESLEQSLQESKPFLMDESVDFIEREEFNEGSKKFRKITDEEFIELYKEFQSLDNFGTDSEFVDFLNKKRIRPGTLGDPRLSKNKKFTTKTVSARRQRLNLKTKVKPKVSPKRQAEAAKINELIQKEVNIANKGSKYISPADISFKVEDQLNMKPYFIDRINAQGKKIKVRDKRFTPNSYPAFKNLDSMVTKVDNVLKEMLISEEPLNDYFYKELAKRTDLDGTTIAKIRNNVPTYKVIADQGADKLLTIKNEPTLKNLSLSQQLVEAIEIEKGMPTYIDYGEGKKQVASPRSNIMQFARRSWNNNKGQGEIKFFNKNGKLIKWERGLKLPYKNVSFSYQGKKYSVNNLTPTLIQKDFPEVKKVTDAANKLRTIQIDDPFNPGKKISVNNLIRKVQVDGYKWKPKFGTINVLHGPEGVKNKPFTNLTYNTRDINQLEAGFTNSLKAGTITETQYKKIIKELYKPFVKGDLDKAIIDRVTKQAQQIEKGKFYGFEDLKTKLGQKKLSALQEIYSRAGMNLDPALAARAVKEELIDPLRSRVPTGKGIRALSTAARIALPEAYFAPASIVLDSYAGRTPREMILNAFTLGFGAPAADAYRKAQVLKDLGFLSDYKKAMAKINRADQALAEEVETLGMNTPAEEFAAPEFTKNERLGALIGQVEDLKLKTRLEEKAAEYERLRENQLKKGLLEVTPDEEALPEDVGIKPEIPIEEEEEEEKSLGFFDRITGNIPRDFMSKGGIMATRLGFASGTGPFPLRLMFMIKDRLNNLKNSTFSNYNDVRMFGEQKGIENILTPYKNVPDKNKLITALEDIEELKKLMPEEYQSILNDIANDTKQFNFKTANDRTKALVETLPSDIDFKKLSDDLFPMPNPENPSMILLGPDNPVSPSRFKTTTEIDTFTGKGKRTTRDYFDEETGEFLEEGKFVDEEPLDEEFSGMIRDMDKPDETN